MGRGIGWLSHWKTWAANRGELKKKSVALTGRIPSITSLHIFKPIGRPEPHQDMSVLKPALGSLGTTRKQPGMISQLQSSFDRYKCTWDGCQQRLPGDKELRDHLSAHSVDALAHWACGSTCTWQGCKSKAKFKTTHQFNTHLENIHAKPLLCTRSRCTYKRPFRNKYELERHNSSKHSAGRPWECPYDYCPSETRAFARKDKWLKHIREVQHENDAFCPYQHCYPSTTRPGKGFEDRKKIATHFNRWHSLRVADGYGCALGSCGNTKIDCEIGASQTLQTPLGNTASTSAQFGMAPA